MIHNCSKLAFMLIFNIFWVQKCICESSITISSSSTAAMDSIRICKWKGGVNACLNLSFDDGCLSHKKIAQIMDQYGFKGTFFEITSSMHVDSVIDIFFSGHEIGSHTFSHYVVNTLDSIQSNFELCGSQEMIEDITGGKCVSFAEPFNINSNIPFSNYLFIRNHSLYEDFNPLEINSNLTIEDVIRYLNNGIKNGDMLLLTGHGIDGDGYSPIKKDFLVQMLDLIKKYSDTENLWVTTIKEGEQYENLYHEISLNKELYGDTLKLKLTNYSAEKYKDLDASPISIEIPYSISQELSCLSDSLVRIKKSADKYIITTDLKNDTSLIFVLNKNIDSITNTDKNSLILYPNPVSGILNLSYFGNSSSIEIYNLKGENILSLNNVSKIIDVSHLAKGYYLIKIKTKQDPSTFYKNKFLKID